MLRRRGCVWIAVLSLAALGCGDDAAASVDSGMAEQPEYDPKGGRCGDGRLDRGEECDGTVLGQSCESLGEERGPLSCTERCTIDTSQCGTNPRPDLPDRTDGGLLIPDAGTLGPICETIIECGAIPFPTIEDGIFELVQGLGPIVYCSSRIDQPCLDCVRQDTFADTDAGEAACTSDCRDECLSLSFDHTIGLFDEQRCASTANDFVSSRYEGQCLCDHCLPELGACLQSGPCHAALLCIDDTGCEGTACAEPGVCRAPIRALSFSSSSEPLDALQECIANAGCRNP